MCYLHNRLDQSVAVRTGKVESSLVSHKEDYKFVQIQHMRTTQTYTHTLNGSLSTPTQLAVNLLAATTTTAAPEAELATVPQFKWFFLFLALCLSM